MDDIVTIPLFPLGIVILPGMELPLHIFEERYKLMISECLAEDRSFGIIFFDGQHMRSTGCTARVIEVTQRYADGRMDILTRGERRFVVLKIFRDKPYFEAHANYLEDLDEPDADSLGSFIDSLRGLLGELYNLSRSSIDVDTLASSDPLELSFAIASLQAFTPVERQVFLEMTSTAERIEKGIRSLTSLVERTRLTQQIHDIIGGNGNPPKELIDLMGSEGRGH